MSNFTIKQLLENAGTYLDLKIVKYPEGTWKNLSNSRYFTAGLLLTGIESNRVNNGIVIFGSTEISFLFNLSEEKRKEALENLFEMEPACSIVTKQLKIPKCLKTISTQTKTTLLTTSRNTSEFIDKLSSILEEYTREVTRLHGVLLDVFGIGVLLKGKSGIGKSEIALDLISRGHSLVADDSVEIHKHHPDVLEGRGTPVVKHHMEIRGLGIISIPRLFGPASVRDKKKIELIINLEKWESEEEYERLGLDDHSTEILGLSVPLLILPVRPGKTMATIIEVAARDRILKLRGINSAKIFQKKLEEALHKNSSNFILEEIVE
jgi:HPr kinase/phosphorylase